MVRDTYSASGDSAPAEGGAAAQPLDIRSHTANLTQELSQLLAASIAAQGQAGKRAPAPAAAGSELANLAALVSASQNQRNVQPSFRDGLSSLSYSRPAQQPPMPPPPAPTLAPPSGGSLLVSEPHDEEPMPIPSTWRQPVSGDDDRWYRQQLGAAGLGLVAGLIVVVPAVLWLSGWIGGAQTKTVTAARAAPEAVVPPVKVAAVKPVQIAAVDPRVSMAAPQPPASAPVEPPPPVKRAAVEPPPAPTPPREPVRSRADELVTLAKRRIEAGDILGAREILQGSEGNASGVMTFMLAETYDPNMLASWQTRGVQANPEKARYLYQRARDLGEMRAQQRIDWLTAN